MSVGISLDYVRNLRVNDLELSVRDGYIVEGLGLYRSGGDTERIVGRAEKCIP